MRIDSTQGDKNWFIYDCEGRRQIQKTVWVDSSTNRFAIGRINAQGNMETKTLEANKIVIVRTCRMVLINPPSEGNPEVIAMELRKMLVHTARVFS